MRSTRGFVGPDGRSNTGLVDHAAGAESAVLDAEIQKRLDAALGIELDSVKARYKLEVAFNEERSAYKAFNGVVVCWTNGGFDNGGGDEAVYFCSKTVEKKGIRRTCSAPIDLKFIGREAAVCAECRQAMVPADLCGQIGFKATTQGWADILTRIFARLECDADIRMGILSGHLKQKTEDMSKVVRLDAGDRITKTREERIWSIYPLRNILKDTSAGADLTARIRAFLEA